MPSKFFGIRRLEMIKNPCPSKRRPPTSSKTREKSGHFCPSCVLPIVVAFIFLFTVAQLIVIHRTIVSYKTRHQAFEDCYGSNSNANDSKILLDLAFSRKFNPAWPNRTSSEEHNHQHNLNKNRNTRGKGYSMKYPYKLPGPRHPQINHIWKSICPQQPNTLKGNISIDLNREIFLDDLTRENPHVQVGGKWTPPDCRPRYTVAIIIPYRYRWKHLKSLMGILHPMMKRQQLAYQIFVAEQHGNYTFNKGVLMNAAFLLAMNVSGNAFDCVIFHDVDLLPEDDRNIYGCLDSPTHLSVGVDVYAYRLPYTSLVGGVFAIGIEQFIQVNGYSNLYWGWGAEDDDMYHRLIANHLRINRPVTAIARYKMLHHGRRLPNQFISPLIRTARLRFPQDGLTTCRFRLVVGSSQPLYTHFLIDIGQPSYFVQNKLASLTKHYGPSKEELRETHFTQGKSQPQQGQNHHLPLRLPPPTPPKPQQEVFYPKKAQKQIFKILTTKKPEMGKNDIFSGKKPEFLEHLPRDGEIILQENPSEIPLDPDVPITEDEDEDLYS